MDKRPSKRNKVYDLFLATWNTLSLFRSGALKQLKSELLKYNIAIAALQEIRWKGDGIMDSGDFMLCYKGSEEKWRKLKEAIKTCTEEVIGFETKKERSELYDEECNIKIQERNRARQKMLDRETRSNVEDYKKKRKEAKKCCRMKKIAYDLNII
ncbi:hypothetical protein C0J52_11562, partial [Blattella germanica]